jgi:hypothetical protein
MKHPRFGGFDDGSNGPLSRGWLVFPVDSSKNCLTIEFGWRTGGRLLESTAKE